MPLLLILIFLCFIPSLAGAGFSQEESEHAKSAFMFADRKNWADARLHAGRTDDKALASLIDWQYVLDTDSGAGFEEITRFIDAHPDWPEQKKLRIRAELSLRDSDVDNDSVIAWFKDEPPITGVGKMALSKAFSATKQGDKEEIERLIREAWKNGDFESPEEKKILEAYGRLFDAKDHEARIDRLLWEEKTGPAKRLLLFAREDYRKLAQTRIDLQDDKKNASSAVSRVDKTLKDNPGLLFDRMQYRARRGDDKGVRDILLATPDVIPYPEKWWKQREIQVREAIDEHNYKLARKLLANHGQVDNSPLADATWLKGWLELEFFNEPQLAYGLFYRMYNDVRYPVSKARAAYWAGRAAEKSGDENAANNWYDTASSYPTSYYGQLASQKRFGTAPLHIPAQPEVSDDAREQFEKRSLVKAIYLSIAFDQMDLANKLITHVVEHSASAAEVSLAAGIGVKSGYPYLSVRAAKKAMQNYVILMKSAYPTPKTPDDISLERALALAIIRQESEFDRHAKSSSGALGYMQLLPATAKENARKRGMSFSPGRLYEPEYNMTLGSHYLSRLINGYDGSYIMAIAAYNAGPGNMRKWIRQFGTPGDDPENAINWIEKIPFSETRNYVQRVIENLQIYRYVESGDEAPKLKIEEDLLR